MDGKLQIAYQIKKRGSDFKNDDVTKHITTQDGKGSVNTEKGK